MTSVLTTLLLTCMVTELYLIWKAIKGKPASEPKHKPDVYVTTSNPELINENMVAQDDSVIVVPKSPQLVAWEEEEEIRKINLRPK